MSNSTQFRTDIQGMRAIAVLAVVAFHIWAWSLPGGFLGVDMFFTVSGYLITMNMLQRHAAGTFTIGDFYNRRIKRLLPAMICLVFVVLAVGSITLLPEDLEALSVSAIFSGLSAANFYFYLLIDTSYFAPSSAEMPLLHLWSLGVEEQFYLIWPLILAGLLHLTATHFRYLLVGIALIASVVLGEVLLGSAPDFAYYMLPTRAFELLAGAMLAMWISDNRTLRFSTLSLNLISIAGLATVVACLLLQSEHDGFPGFSAVPITIGTLLLLAMGSYGRSIITPILSCKPMTWIGDLSYSLYLWHWPVLAYTRYALVEIDIPVGFTLFVIMLGLASCSYYFVEQPLRHSTRKLSQTLVRFVFVPAALLLCFGFATSLGDGVMPWTNIKGLEQARVKSDPPFKANYVCQKVRLKKSHLNESRCIVGDATDGEPEVLLWGDSNAAHFAGMLKIFAEAGGFSFRNIAHSACPPIFGEVDSYTSNRYRKSCQTSKPIVESVLSEYKVIVLGASWQSYQDSNVEFARRVISTVERLVASGKDVILLPYIQRFANLDRTCAARGVHMPFIDCQRLFTIEGPDAYQMNEVLEQLSREHSSVQYFDANQYLCPENRCSAYLGAKLIYFDGGHFSADGSEQFGRYVLETDGLPAFARKLARRN